MPVLKEGVSTARVILMCCSLTAQAVTLGCSSCASPQACSLVFSSSSEVMYYSWDVFIPQLTRAGWNKEPVANLKLFFFSLIIYQKRKMVQPKMEFYLLVHKSLWFLSLGRNFFARCCVSRLMLICAQGWRQDLNTGKASAGSLWFFTVLCKCYVLAWNLSFHCK